MPPRYPAGKLDYFANYRETWERIRNEENRPGGHPESIDLSVVPTCIMCDKELMGKVRIFIPVMCCFLTSGRQNSPWSVQPANPLYIARKRLVSGSLVALTVTNEAPIVYCGQLEERKASKGSLTRCNAPQMRCVALPNRRVAGLITAVIFRNT